MNDFDESEGDLIDVSALGIAGFEELDVANDADGNAVIDTDGGTITLRAVDAADLDGSEFIFAA